MSDDLLIRLRKVYPQSTLEKYPTELIFAFEEDRRDAVDRIENLINALEGIKQWSHYSGSTQHIYEMACNALNPDFVPPTNEKETK